MHALLLYLGLYANASRYVKPLSDGQDEAIPTQPPTYAWCISMLFVLVKAISAGLAHRLGRRLRD